MMLDDITEQNDDETLTLESTQKLKWFMLDTERTPVKVWEFIINILIIYSLYITPFIIVFKCVYSCFLCEKVCNSTTALASLIAFDYECVEKYNYNCVDDSYQQTLQLVELFVDIILTFDIVLNFLKKTRINFTLKAIAFNYLTGYFIFDVIATIPFLFT